MTTKFIQPVSMRVTQEQYLRDLREPLLAMGYDVSSIFLSSDKWVIITTNISSVSGAVSKVSEDRAKCYNRHFIPDYNPEYFLAVAAMTSEKFGIVGEWWRFKVQGYDEFTYNKLYKCIGHNINNKAPIFISNKDTYNGLTSNAQFQILSKATLSDLINKFEPKINKNTNNMELTEKEKEVLVKLVTKENEAIFEKIGVKRDKNPIKRLGTETETLKSILHYICVAFRSADEVDRKDLIGRSFTIIAQNNFKFVLHEKNGFQVLEITEK